MSNTGSELLGQQHAWVYVDLKTTVVGGFVANAKQLLSEQLDLPAGYAIVWSGQFEYMERAAARLRIVIPMTLFMIFLLLYLNFGNMSAPAMVMFLSLSHWWVDSGLCTDTVSIFSLRWRFASLRLVSL